MTPPFESGIILPVPEAEPIVGDLRRVHDPQTRYGVPAHITLLYPFAHPSKVGDVIENLREAFSLISAFDFSLVEVRRFSATAYLHPEPVAALIQLIKILSDRWPEFPPYGGSFSTVVPHLTIADQATADVLDSVDETVSGHLPISCRAVEAWLLCSDTNGVWSKREEFQLRDRHD